MEGADVKDIPGLQHFVLNLYRAIDQLHDFDRFVFVGFAYRDVWRIVSWGQYLVVSILLGSKAGPRKLKNYGKKR